MVVVKYFGNIGFTGGLVKYFSSAILVVCAGGACFFANQRQVLGPDPISSDLLLDQTVRAMDYEDASYIAFIWKPINTQS